MNIYSYELTKYEATEILKFKEVYYVGQIRAKLLFTDEALPNYGWDDRKGFYEANNHDHIYYRYEIVSCLGKGSFGIVFKCFDHKYKKSVALKMLRNKPKYHKQGMVEVNILRKLQDPTKLGSRFIVSLLDNFVFRNHIGIVQELLDIDLYKLIKTTGYHVIK
jgi:dual specificity tyrosine-phosphorylation-regulated kinase 2/3/4